MQPCEPNTPPGSVVWRFIHHPMTLLVLSVPMILACVLLYGTINRAMGAKTNDSAGLLSAFIGAGIFFGAYWLFVRFVERRPVDEFAFPPAAKELAIGFAIGVALLSVVVGVIAALGSYRVIGTRGAEVLPLALSIGIFPGFSEEIAIRGLFFRLFERWLGSWAALALSAAFFGAGHLANPNATWVAAAGIAFEAGIMLAAVYMITRRLWVAIGLHAAWNFAEGGIYGTPVSGLSIDGLLRPWIGGSDLITGGAFGPEASLPAMAVATAVGVVFLVIAWRRGNFIAPSWVRRRQLAGAQE
ncbi:CPBP family intramembrane metalloprotease [Sphingomonas panacisoli]|uniref:CPBP family intramembrane metalloprotease n=1 Tax=Sphingomonas panacisoli TaxID=1813879 RepID=A0A5B8LKT8_9SPHN|nr:CPBP family intramembrane glutamic endopeptidase [Sphingomonas panacisoli]QDZ08355.1 CPBP family intramembrane metalloprotease [Sphingomonas panacisoli]